MEDKKSYDTRRILREMQDEYWRGIEGAGEAVAVETSDYVIFRLAGERFGVPSGIAREILKMPTLVRIPRVGERVQENGVWLEVVAAEPHRINALRMTVLKKNGRDGPDQDEEEER